MKILKYLKLDIVSTLMMLVFIGLFILHLIKGIDVSLSLLLAILFIFRGIMWQGQYVDRIRELEEENESIRGINE
jgi:hypothetical protein